MLCATLLYNVPICVCCVPTQALVLHYSTRNFNYVDNQTVVFQYTHLHSEQNIVYYKKYADPISENRIEHYISEILFQGRIYFLRFAPQLIDLGTGKDTSEKI